MHRFSLNAFCRIVGEGRKTVQKLVTQGDITQVKKRCDRLEFDADAALNYLAKKYPELLKAKDEYAPRQLRSVKLEIVKNLGDEEIVKEWARRG